MAVNYVGLEEIPMKKLLLFPHQLFDPEIIKQLDFDEVVLVEHSYFYKRLKFHKQKLVLHYASLRAYKKELEKARINCKLVEFEKAKNWKPAKSYNWLVFDPIEKKLEKELQKWQKTVEFEIYESPAFMTTTDELEEYFRTQKWFMAEFYKFQRKRLGILVDENDKPIGGKWSFDEENRSKLPIKTIVPESYSIPENEFVEEAKKWVKKNFKNNPGEIEEFLWPIDRDQAFESLQNFLRHKFSHFGKFQDSIEADKPFLFHSLLSSSINIGLITPDEVVDEALIFAKKHEVPMNSLEGFIRQIIGWREYMRAVYLLRGEKMMRANFWKFKKKKLSIKFYNGETEIEPLDKVISHVNKFAYAHHIERLMILGNFMLLTEQHPDEVNRWFTEMFIDAYEWVMVPNVFGMSQFADGDEIVTKPYISGSNYIRKMSRYKKGDWSEKWDALYWSFVAGNRKVLAKNHRFGLIMKVFEKFSESEIGEYKKMRSEVLKMLK